MGRLSVIVVSILVLVEFRLGVSNDGSPSVLSSVSILVLVEFRLGVPLPFSSPDFAVKFQSLFWWNFVWGNAALSAIAVTVSLVSILVLVEFRLGVRLFAYKRGSWASFNPCSGGISSGGRG